jgi:hypothetical protein
MVDTDEERENTTSNLYSIFPKSQEIIEKYSTDSNRVPSIKVVIQLLPKEISTVLVGIEKRLTHHIARKTFASTVCNDVPMIVSRTAAGSF